MLLADALLVAPATRPGWTAAVVDWATGSWAGHEPWVVAHFQLMGVWPVVLAAMLAPWLRGRPVPLWPFSLGAFALGGFVLLPGVALPRRGGAPVGWLASRWLAVACAVPSVALVAWAVWMGSPTAWLEAFRSMQFVHVMAVDFAVLWGLSIGVAQARDGRGWLCVVPLLGAVAWLLTHVDAPTSPTTTDRRRPPG